MSYTHCASCNEEFWREEEESWKRLCLACWKRSKKAESTGDRQANYRSEAAYWRRRAEEAESRLRAASVPAVMSIDLATLKRIRMLVHPDKHGDSAAANQVTQVINGMIRSAS